MSWGPHDLRLAEVLAEQRLEAARRARVNMKRRLRGRGAPDHGLGLGHLHLHWPIHLHHAAHGAVGHTDPPECFLRVDGAGPGDRPRRVPGHHARRPAPPTDRRGSTG